MTRVKAHRGFTLLEVMAAMAIMAMLMTGVLSLHGAAHRAVRSADLRVTATMLARAQLAEAVLELEKQIAEGKFPESNEKSNGEFEGKAYDRYRWALEVRKVEIPIPPSSEGDDAGAGIGALLQTFIERLQFEDSVREVFLRVTWDARGGEQHVDVTTHVVKL